MRPALILLVALSTAAAPATAVRHVLAIDPPQVKFGRQPFGSFTLKNFTITNRSSEAVLVSIETTDVGDDFSPGQPESTCTLTDEALLGAGGELHPRRRVRAVDLLPGPSDRDPDRDRARRWRHGRRHADREADGQGILIATAVPERPQTGPPYDLGPDRQPTRAERERGGTHFPSLQEGLARRRRLAILHLVGSRTRAH